MEKSQTIIFPSTHIEVLLHNVKLVDSPSFLFIMEEEGSQNIFLQRNIFEVIDSSFALNTHIFWHLTLT
jgi:hypothetical protein